MTETTDIAPRQPGQIDDPLNEVLRAGALLAQAVEAEVEALAYARGYAVRTNGRTITAVGYAD